MRFVADTMLGTLAKWLRILGFDTFYAKDMNDDEILLLAERDGRTIISRDRELCGRRAGSLLLDKTELDAQINQVVQMFPVNEEVILSRCLECNSLLEVATRVEALGKVPEGVTGRYEDFWHCAKCDRFYWAGSHWINMKEKAKTFLA